VWQGQVADDDVEATIREGEGLCVALPELGSRETLPGDLNHRLSYVDSHGCEVVPGLVELEVAVPHLSPAVR
jgi:hypothetical protein